MIDSTTLGGWLGDQEEVLFDLTSPGFPTQYPHVINPELITPEALRMMEACWKSNWDTPHKIRAFLLRNVFVAGDGIIYNQALEPFLPSLWPSRPHQVESSRALIISALARNAVPIHDLRAILCRKTNNRNYGHWLIEMLPKAVIARQQLGADLGVIVHAGTPSLVPVINRALELLAIPESLVIRAGDEPHYHRELVVMVGLTRHGRYMSPLAPAAVRQMAERIPSSPNAARKIYVSRVKGSAREIVNQDDLLPVLARRGFTVVTSGGMSLDDQCRMFRGADTIVGAMGADLANLVFSEPGTRAVLMAPQGMPDTFFWFLAQHRQLVYSEVRSPTIATIDPRSWNNNFSVNPSDLAAALDRL